VSGWSSDPSGFPRAVRLAVGALLGAGALTIWSQAPSAPASTRSAGSSAKATVIATKEPAPPGAGAKTVATATSPALLKMGEQLYDQSCASCHGLQLQGRKATAPTLRGVGAGPVDFYLSTGRMPLANPRAQPTRSTPAFDRRQIDALIAYVRRAGGGPAAPSANSAAGSLSLGFKLFDENCAGCHSIVARGGTDIGAQVPNLQQATAQEIAEAVRMGPYLMPRFSATQLNQRDLNSIVRYVLWTRHPDNPGGWGIYNIGPIPEGIVAWFLGLLALVIVARLIGERVE
jgi:ubiquinol-cytochrome c reductase cytochrome c subunit